ncbi:hypothetical protein PHMEG_00020800 [Phytophthora megakarya]|uniref:Retrotransposon gag domain-containing protein n=1 Tax=Phytophthora megakarya TaxID=4795 RepID=A0A225VMZ5_9STRA|nr:hypothetical protein PHMEG_00020799 [Phytophthora megakarya]OWZ06886.1 hypothetical protein PHMEG_00020800 [Phytophthora megakarya]
MFAARMSGEVGERWWLNSRLPDFGTLKRRFYNRFIRLTNEQLLQRLFDAVQDSNELVDDWGRRVTRYCDEALLFNEKMRFQMFVNGLRSERVRRFLDCVPERSIEMACEWVLAKGFNLPEREDEMVRPRVRGCEQDASGRGGRNGRNGIRDCGAEDSLSKRIGGLAEKIEAMRLDTQWFMKEELRLGQGLRRYMYSDDERIQSDEPGENEQAYDGGRDCAYWDGPKCDEDRDYPYWDDQESVLDSGNSYWDGDQSLDDCGGTYGDDNSNSEVLEEPGWNSDTQGMHGGYSVENAVEEVYYEDEMNEEIAAGYYEFERTVEPRLREFAELDVHVEPVTTAGRQRENSTVGLPVTRSVKSKTIEGQESVDNHGKWRSSDAESSARMLGEAEKSEVGKATGNGKAAAWERLSIEQGGPVCGNATVAEGISTDESDCFDTVVTVIPCRDGSGEAYLESYKNGSGVSAVDYVPLVKKIVICGDYGMGYTQHAGLVYYDEVCDPFSSEGWNCVEVVPVIKNWGRTPPERDKLESVW